MRDKTDGQQQTGLKLQSLQTRLSAARRYQCHCQSAARHERRVFFWLRAGSDDVAITWGFRLVARSSAGLFDLLPVPLRRVLEEVRLPLPLPLDLRAPGATAATIGEPHAACFGVPSLVGRATSNHIKCEVENMPSYYRTVRAHRCFQIACPEQTSHRLSVWVGGERATAWSRWDGCRGRDARRRCPATCSRRSRHRRF